MEFGIAWKWTDLFMRALTGCAVLLCAVGFIAPSFDPESHEINGMAFCVGIGLSAACALCLLLSNAAAADAPVLFRHNRWFSGALAIGVFVGGAMVSMKSMHTGWIVFAELVRGYPLPSDSDMGWAFAYVAYVKPVVNWIIQAKKSILAELRLAEQDKDRAESERRAERMAESDGRTKRNLEAESRRKQFRVASTATLAAASVIGIPAAANAESMDMPKAPVMESAHVGAESADAEAHAAHGWKGPRDQEKWNLFKECLRRGMTNQKEIAETVGIPTTTAHRWFRMATNGIPEAASA